MLVNQFLILSAFLFCVGAYGVMVRKHAVLVLMSIELMINSVNMNLIAFALRNDNVIGHVFALFVIAVAAAEVGVGLAIVLLIYRNKRSVDPGDASEMKG
jgi:NADH:ubiquinone oxidoreductase subunit K